MTEELNFTPSSALISNLDRLSEEYSIAGEQRLLELGDVASEIADRVVQLVADGLTLQEAVAFIGETLSVGTYPISAVTSSVAVPQVEKYVASLSAVDRSALAQICVCALASRGLPVAERDFLRDDPMPETFTYVRNSFSDEAYDVFSSDFTDPRVRYASSFRECAALVSDGSVSYCLLPLEERGGVRLPTVTEIIYTNDFKINSVIPVFGPDGTADIKYALVSRSFTVSPRNGEDDRYLELRLDSSASTVAQLMSALMYYGMGIFRMNTFTPRAYGESETHLSLVVRDGDMGFTPLLVYLTLWGIDFTPVGMYKNLE